MIIRACYRLLALGLPALILVGIFSASAATSAVPQSSLDDIHLSVTANDLKPPQCAAQNVTRVIADTGTISGTASSDLILGGPGADTISGEGGNDCIVGGAGDDTLIGSSGNDTCIGGPGADTLDATCEREEP